VLDLSDDPGTNLVLDATHTGAKVPARMAAVIFISTVMTHLCGGSAGREGAALQIGGGLSSAMSRALKLDESTRRVLTLCGMAAVFSALFGTPVAAAVFCIEMVSVGEFKSAELLPCMLASFTAQWIARLMGAAPAAYAINGAPAFGFGSLLAALALGAACALMSVAFCEVMHRSAHFFAKSMPNRYLRALAGGAIVVALTLIVGSRDYNGAGGDVILRAIEQGRAVPYAFALKLLFTAVTLGCGFKGGEIVPAFFVGATLGCMLGPLLGVSASFGAAICMIAVFCGVANCPIASILISVELFGAQSLALFAVACAASFMLSGRFSLYSSQRFLFSKVTPDSEQ